MKPRSGEGFGAASVSELEYCLDALSLYAALTDNGSRTDTMLFEQSEGPTFILDQAAARIECRGENVSLTALTPNGRDLLKLVKDQFPGRLAGLRGDHLRLHFPRMDEADCGDRLKAPSPFDVLRAISTGLAATLSIEPRNLLSLGIIAYDHVDLFEDLPEAAEDPLGFPDFLFWVAERFFVFESGQKPRAVCVSFRPNGTTNQNDLFERANSWLTRFGDCASATSPQAKHKTERLMVEADVDLTDESYAALVASLKEHIAAGDVYQIVASRTFSRPCSDAFGAFQVLRTLDPSPYHFFVSAEPYHLFGASPETSVRVFRKDGLHVELKPIAGTRPRGQCADEDDRIELELRLDPKEQAEHVMLVDLARNDIARISQPGTRRVTQMMAVERYARVMHLVSRVTGKLRQGLDSIDALKACLNMGTLTGTPKIRATELLRRAERTKRGPYGGAIAWLSGDGSMDSAIVIRSAIVKDGIAFVRAGAGIVHDSDPLAEADESRRKASAVLSALAEPGE